MADIGTLQVQLFKEDTYIPIENAKVIVSMQNEDGMRAEEQIVKTGTSGMSNILELSAPSIEYSMRPSDNRPYSLCDIRIEAEGYKNVAIKGCQIFPQTLAIQPFRLKPETRNRQVEIIEIPENTLFGKYPPKIPEDPSKPLPPPPTGFVVLPEPVVPEFVIVHAGSPSDDNAPNYTVKFDEYIKNVASCEIYSTWPKNTVTANVLCMLSFTLNRIYTEWYRGKGKNFDITSSTAFDQAFSYGRNYFANVSRVVDEIFTSYIKRPGAKQPLLTQYCDGQSVQCPEWLSQWGSKALGDTGKTDIEIIKNYYGNNIVITQATKVKGIPKSYPGYTLKIGSTGEPVRVIQRFLNRISQNFPEVQKVIVDGVYGKKTQGAVIAFQKLFNLTPSGEVDYATWYKISNIYVGVTKIAELR